MASDDTRLRGDRNDKQNVKGNNAQSVKQNGDKIDLILNLLDCHCVHIRILSGLYLRVNPSAYLSGVMDASRKLPYNVFVPSYLPLGYTYYATHFMIMMY